MHRLRNRSVNRVCSLAGASVLVVSGVMLASAAPAAAHDTCIGHPSDSSVACLRSDHLVVDACDRDSDGHQVWARVHYSNGAIVSFFDTNGATPDCGNYVPAWYANGFYISYNVCVETEGCGSPRYRPGWGSPTW
jgi:hypothetical protein